MNQDLMNIQAAFLRGTFINHVSNIEKMMEYYIANHFCADKDKIEEMVVFLTGDRFVSFESKKLAFEWIMKKHSPSSYQANSKNFKLLETIQTERNKLAHLMLNNTKDAIEKFEADGTISFLKFSNSSKILFYDKLYVEKIMNDVITVYNWMLNFRF